MTLFAARCAIFLLLVVPCVLGARWMAGRKGKSAKAWMLAAALFGPFPLLLLAFLQ